jgi:hypothetical protein
MLVVLAQRRRGQTSYLIRPEPAGLGIPLLNSHARVPPSELVAAAREMIRGGLT